MTVRQFLLFRAPLSREASHPRHDRFQIRFGAGYFLRTPHSDVPVHLSYSLQHLLDEPSQLRIRPAIGHPLGGRHRLLPRAWRLAHTSEAVGVANCAVPSPFILPLCPI